ncbi:hypothetical protein FKR81_33390 [Lentzea tibetensis]|uniref:Uncharacterized protein n=1 Tax=Lentzea tibetensis TaxID=2591470 RepID=A0A563EK98_9PSEU|nr:hypothetical protein [Lentzea tibetensis]TWP46954.1 hypothetical protein FKR81_33390 [Lentzea tibetensis]
MIKSFNEDVVTIRVPAPPLGVDLTNDGTLAAVAMFAAPGVPSVCVYDTTTGELVTKVAETAGFGRSAVFGKDGRSLYGLVEDASCLTVELREYPLGEDDGVLLATYARSEDCYALVRNRAADALAVLGRDVRVLRANGAGSPPEVVRIIPGGAPSRRAHARLSADSAHVYYSTHAADHVVRWDLERDREDRRWPTPGVNGRIAISRSGRHLIVRNHGVQGVVVLDTETGERFMPDDFNEESYTGEYAFAPDERGFAYQAGGRAGFREWSQERTRGPKLHDGRILGLHGAWDADVYVYEYAEFRLCVARMS